jgi:hypothetical protein
MDRDHGFPRLRPASRRTGRPDHFQEFGGSPGNSYTWVLHDDLTVSLLQARLNLPIDVEIGTRD